MSPWSPEPARPGPGRGALQRGSHPVHQGAGAAARGRAVGLGGGLCALTTPCCLSLLGLDASVRPGSSWPSRGWAMGCSPAGTEVRGQRAFPSSSGLGMSGFLQPRTTGASALGCPLQKDWVDLPGQRHPLESHTWPSLCRRLSPSHERPALALEGAGGMARILLRPPASEGRPSWAGGCHSPACGPQGAP